MYVVFEKKFLKVKGAQVGFALYVGTPYVKVKTDEGSSTRGYNRLSTLEYRYTWAVTIQQTAFRENSMRLPSIGIKRTLSPRSCSGSPAVIFLPVESQTNGDSTRGSQ